MALVAAVMTFTLVVDPFGLGLAGQAAHAATASEDRAQNFKNALELLPKQDVTPASTITGSYPAVVPGELPAPAASLPAKDQATVAVANTATAVDLGGMAVQVAAADTGTAPDSVTLKVEDAATAQAAGVEGVLLDVESTALTAVPDDPTVELTVSYAKFAGLYGGDWASRLQVVRLPDCRTETPTASECQPQPLETVNDRATQTVSAIVPVDAPALSGGQGMSRFTGATSSGGGALAVTAGVAGSGGNWSQTGLPQSSTWGMSGNTGAFTWSYPLTLPAPATGQAPDLTLSYSSAVPDGRVPSRNNQSGWIGEGFDLTASYIERQYKPCSRDDGAGANNHGLATGDLCWGPANATMVMHGAASPLVPETSGNKWHPKSDDGTRVELNKGGSTGSADGEYWKVTTTDGTQYFFGSDKDLKSRWTVPVFGNNADEPCHQTGFSDSMCTQVWRWNLDHVIDPTGNKITYTYATETNAYANDWQNNRDRTSISYVSGGRLTAIEYGTPPNASTTAPFKITFDAKTRCLTDPKKGDTLCDGTVTNDRPDIPTDLLCIAPARCDNASPIFFDTTRLAKVTAQVLTDVQNKTYKNLDSWVFTQRFVGEGDNGHIDGASSVNLRLDSVQHTGERGTPTIALPPVQFGYQSMANRVDSGTDGYSPLSRDRLTKVRTESGGAVAIDYQTDCRSGDVPATTEAAQKANTLLCYLAKWQPERSAERSDWFHKYVVKSIVEDGAPKSTTDPSLITGSLDRVTRYEYLDGAAWVKPTGPMIEESEQTFSEFRGFKRVRTTLGSEQTRQPVSDVTYFRGAGDSLPLPGHPGVFVKDEEEFAGQPFDTVTLNGAVKLAETVTVPGNPVDVPGMAVTGGLKSTRIPSVTTYGFSYDATGHVVRQTSSTTSKDDAGLPVMIDDQGDFSTPDDDLCTKTSYRRDATFKGDNKLSYPEKTEIFGVGCTGTLDKSTLLRSASTTYNKNGQVLTNSTLDFNNKDVDVVRSTTTYNGDGSIASTEDAEGNVTKFQTEKDAAGLVLSRTTTAPDPNVAGATSKFTTTQEFDPRTLALKKTTDLNGLETNQTTDALGRVTSIRYPQQTDPTKKASVEYEYSVQPNGLNAVLTRTLGADGVRQHTSVTLYDGLGRPFQQQAEAANSISTSPTRMVQHVFYDSAGRVRDSIAPWVAEGSPVMSAVTPISAPVAHTTYAFDDAGRVTTEVLWNGTDSNSTNEKWRTTTVYNGSATLTIPPIGGIPTETVTDAHGRTVELREYARDPDTASAAVGESAVRALPMQKTTYAYDRLGQLTTLTSPGGAVWSYTYDNAGQQASATDPDAGTTTTTYYPSGRVKTVRNANADAAATEAAKDAATLTYDYDHLGRKIRMRAGTQVRAWWTYDTATLPGGKPALGQLAKATRDTDGNQDADAGDYTTTYPSYDTAYQPKEVLTTLPDSESLFGLRGGEFRTKYSYTVDGQVAKITYPKITGTNSNNVVLGSETVTTHFDSNSRPSWMGGGFGWGIYVADSAWNPDGTPSGFDIGNTYSTDVTYQWDPVTGRLTGTNVSRPEKEAGKALAVTYGYDAAGNVTSTIDAPTSASTVTQKDAQCFQYDGLRRLQVAWAEKAGTCATPSSSTDSVAPYWSEYSYDALGNRTGKTDRSGNAPTTTTTYTYDSAHKHQLNTMTAEGGSPGTTNFTWDAAGNQTGRSVEGGQAQVQQWDVEGKLAKISAGDDVTSNVYDADGSRMVRIDKSGVSVFLPDGQELHATPSTVTTSSTVTATRWYSFAGKTVAMRTGKGHAGVTSIITDPHGTPIATLKNTDRQAALERIRTEPFGNARTSQVGTVAGRGFLGAPADGTGLTLLGARFYDPGTGTFISVDPLMITGLTAQFNPYQYGGHNPMTFADPSGKCYEAGFGDALSLKNRCAGGIGKSKFSATTRACLLTS